MEGKGRSRHHVVGNRVANNEEAEGTEPDCRHVDQRSDLAGLFADNAQMGTGRARRSTSRSSATSSAWSPSTDAGELEHLEGRVDLRPDHSGPYMMGFAGVWHGYAAAHGVRLPKNVDTGVGTVTKAPWTTEARRPARCLEASAGRVRRQLASLACRPISRMPGRAFIDGFFDDGPFCSALVAVQSRCRRLHAHLAPAPAD